MLRTVLLLCAASLAACATAPAPAGEARQSGWFTLVWVHTGAGWKLVHDDAS